MCTADLFHHYVAAGGLTLLWIFPLIHTEHVWEVCHEMAQGVNGA